jgi:hypothetical protein
MAPYDIEQNDFGVPNLAWHRVIPGDGLSEKDPTRSKLEKELQFVNEIAETRNGQPSKNEEARKNLIYKVHGKTDLLKGGDGVKLTQKTA